LRLRLQKQPKQAAVGRAGVDPHSTSFSKKKVDEEDEEETPFISSIFSAVPSATTPPAGNRANVAPPPVASGTAQRPTVVHKKPSDIGTPSIRQALAGNMKAEEEKQKVVVPENYAKETRQIDKPFDEQKLNEAWNGFAEKYVTEVHLYNTLSNKLKLLDNSYAQIEVENSVQLDQVRLLKPEIIGYLRKKLENSRVDLKIELIKINHESRILTEDQKLQQMIQKNPALMKLKARFNLDFNG
jgi:DNA polymerase III subunit gamma/tau